MATVSLLRSKRPLPAAHRSNFIHLYLDIAWFGVLNGSAISFMAIFAVRQGADAFQVGLLNAGPAIVNLIFTLPAGQWLQHRAIDRSVFRTSVWHRLFYLAWIFLPLWLAPHVQVWLLIWLVLLMTIPGTALAVGFNALFAAAVPPEWRSHVVGVRNGLLAVVFIGTSLLCGWLLQTLPFPLGYQVVFGLGFVGAVMSSLHLHFVRVASPVAPPRNGKVGDQAQPGFMRTNGHSLRLSVGLRYFTRLGQRPFLPTRLLRGPFGLLVGLLFLFHLVQYLAIPLLPLFWVNVLRLTDAEISLGNAVFYGAVLLGSTQLDLVTRRWNHKGVLVLGVTVMSLYPALTAATTNLTLFLVTAVVGGCAWSLVGGAIGNYLLEQIPEGERPSHLAWYNMGLNAAILLGALGGPLLSDQMGLIAALLLIAGGRFVAALALWRWG